MYPPSAADDAEGDSSIASADTEGILLVEAIGSVRKSDGAGDEAEAEAVGVSAIILLFFSLEYRFV